MELDRIAIALRPRTPWEAMDLGFAMARNWWCSVWAAWLAVFLPVALLLHLLLAEHAWAVTLILWWLKPVFDRFVLHVLAGAVFGAPPGVVATLRSFRQALSPGWLASLTLYRFDFARSFNLPVWQLERSSGGAARARARVLHRKARSHAVWLSVICVHFELIIALSLYMMIDFLTPGPYDLDVGLTSLFQPGADPPPWMQLVQNACYLLAVTLVEPFYVAAGFALYLNRRTQLEAWDVELAFKRLNAGSSGALPGVASVFFALALIAMSGNSPAIAAEQTAREARDQSARAELEQVLKDPVFDQYKESRVWRYTGRGWGLSEGERADSGGTDWRNLGQLLAELARALLWIAAAVLLAWLARRALNYYGCWYAQRQAAYRPPDALFGFDLRAESLPADVASSALALCAQQRVRAALSLLYRGALSRLVNERRVDLRVGDTEQDCLDRVAAHAERGMSDYFAQLVDAWRETAYARRLPPVARTQQLCHDWRAHFNRGKPA